MIRKGDIVKINDDLYAGSDYKWYVTDEMEGFAGRLATIERIKDRDDGVYEIDLDDGRWGWTDDMFTVVGMNDDDIKYELEEIDILFD